MPSGDPTDPVAKAVRAARHYSGMSRKQLGAEVGVSPGTIGRYERGEWKRNGPNRMVLQGIARATDVAKMLDVFRRAEADPATRFVAVAKREAEKQDEHPESEREDPPDEDAKGPAL